MTAGTAIVELNKLIKEAEETLRQIQPDQPFDSPATIRLDGMIIGYKRALALMQKINK